MNPCVRLSWKKRLVVLAAGIALAGPVLVASAADRTNRANSNSTAEADKDAAERALERTLVRTGALLLSQGQFEVEPSFYYARNEQEVPGSFVDSGGFLHITAQHVSSNVFGAAVQLRAGLPAETQVELSLPYNRVTEERITEENFAPISRTTAHSSGMGDASLGLAKVLLTERGARPNLVARLTWDSDTGKTDDSVSALSGTGFNEARFSLIATRRQDPLVFLGGLSYQKAFKKNDVKPGDEVGVSVGTILAASPDTSLRLILDQRFVSNTEVRGRTLDGSDTVVGTLTFGASSIVGANRFLDFTIQTGLTDAAPDFAFGVSLTMRFGR